MHEFYTNHYVLKEFLLKKNIFCHTYYSKVNGSKGKNFVFTFSSPKIGSAVFAYMY